MADEVVLEIKGMDELNDRIAEVVKRMAGGGATVRLAFGGPAAPYAVFVHENQEAHHANGEAKFLEKPLNEAARTLPQEIGQMLMAGQTPGQALRTKGELIMTKAKQLTPVRTGALRDSGVVEGG